MLQKIFFVKKFEKKKKLRIYFILFFYFKNLILFSKNKNYIFHIRLKKTWKRKLQKVKLISRQLKTSRKEKANFIKKPSKI